MKKARREPEAEHTDSDHEKVCSDANARRREHPDEEEMKG